MCMQSFKQFYLEEKAGARCTKVTDETKEGYKKDPKTFEDVFKFKLFPNK